MQDLIQEETMQSGSDYMEKHTWEDAVLKIHSLFGYGKNP